MSKIARATTSKPGTNLRLTKVSRRQNGGKPRYAPKPKADQWEDLPSPRLLMSPLRAKGLQEMYRILSCEALCPVHDSDTQKLCQEADRIWPRIVGQWGPSLQSMQK